MIWEIVLVVVGIVLFLVTWGFVDYRIEQLEKKIDLGNYYLAVALDFLEVDAPPLITTEGEAQFNDVMTEEWKRWDCD